MYSLNKKNFIKNGFFCNKKLSITEKDVESINHVGSILVRQTCIPKNPSTGLTKN